MSVKHIINELERLQPKARAFMLEFFAHKTGTKEIDNRNFNFEVDSQVFKEESRMKALFDPMNELNEKEIKALQRKFKL